MATPLAPVAASRVACTPRPARSSQSEAAAGTGRPSSERIGGREPPCIRGSHAAPTAVRRSVSGGRCHGPPAAALAHVVGIDVAAASLAVVMLPAAGTPTPARTFANDAAGWRELQRHLRAQGCQPAATLLVMEATGSYWVGAASALVAAGWAVSVVSPASARAYARATLRRAKTDAVDAGMLAAYGRDLRPAAWTPPPPEVRELQLLVRQRDDLVALQTQTRNRQHALARLPAVPAEVLTPAEAVLAVLAEQIARLDALIRRQRALAAAAGGGHRPAGRHQGRRAADGGAGGGRGSSSWGRG